jgi:hypothetical protein
MNFDKTIQISEIRDKMLKLELEMKKFIKDKDKVYELSNEYYRLRDILNGL